jgi:signal transduction histidine kinase
MTSRVPFRGQPWRLAIAAVGALVLVLVAIGVIGLVINASVARVVDEALRYDIELEDEADDLRVASLDLQAYHRLILLTDPTPLRAEQLGERHELLLAELDELEALEELGALDVLLDRGAARPDELRDLARAYYADFRPALDAFLDRRLSRAAFDDASDRGLARLEELENDAIELDNLGDVRGDAAIASIESATATGFVVLAAVIVGLSLVAGLVALGGVLMVREGRRLLAAQEVATAEAARAARAKDDFIADASHELRTPLTVLRGNAELGLSMAPDYPPEILEEIATEARRMTRLVDDLLLLARSDAASLPLETQVVEAEPFLTEVGDRARMLVSKAGGGLRVSIEDSAPLDIDPTRVEQAIQALVDNAAKYGGATWPIELTARRSGPELHISVRDRGPGIPPEALPSIFERFYRADRNRSRSAGGTGLGLAIAKTIAEAHAGRIEVESRLGAGTVMTLVLPIRTAARAPEARPDDVRPHAGEVTG